MRLDSMLAASFFDAFPSQARYVEGFGPVQEKEAPGLARKEMVDGDFRAFFVVDVDARTGRPRFDDTVEEDIGYRAFFEKVELAVAVGKGRIEDDSIHPPFEKLADVVFFAGDIARFLCP